MMKTASESVTETAVTQTAKARMLVRSATRQIGHIQTGAAKESGSMDR